MDMKCFGYYIVKPLGRPDWCTLSSEALLSMSEDGLSEIFPALEKCFWVNYPESDRIKYREYLKLSDGEFASFRKEVADLFENKRLCTDGRFIDPEDALRLHRYLKNVSGYKIVGIFTDPQIFAEFEDEGTFDELPAGKDYTLPMRKIGCDILGCQSLGKGYHSFTSYIACSLNEEIEKKSDVSPVISEESGLLQNTYEQTSSFCDLIQGQGEPVIWTPFEVYEILQPQA